MILSTWSVDQRPPASEPGIIVVGRDRQILFKNTNAEQLLGHDRALRERRLAVSSRAGVLEARLRSVIDCPQRATGPDVIPMPRPGAAPLWVMVIPLQPTDVEVLGAALLVWDPEIRRPRVESLLCQTYGLTRAEAQTAVAIYRGATPAEIAESRHRSITTVRTQLAQVFLKCGVRRQAELVRLVAGFATTHCFADGMMAGIELGRLLPPAGTRQTSARSWQFKPGEATPQHYHTHGHEILCVIEGELSTEIAGHETWLTRPGEARYVAQHLSHRGINLHRQNTVHMLAIDVTQRGLPYKVIEAPAASG